MASMKRVTLVSTGMAPMPLPELLVLDIYVPELLTWYRTGTTIQGKQSTYTVRGLLPVHVRDEEARVLEVTVAREHLAYIAVEDVREES